MFENGIKKLHGDLKMIWNKLTPGRYRVPNFGQTKKNDVNG